MPSLQRSNLHVQSKQTRAHPKFSSPGERLWSHTPSPYALTLKSINKRQKKRADLGQQTCCCWWAGSSPTEKAAAGFWRRASTRSQRPPYYHTLCLDFNPKFTHLSHTACCCGGASRKLALQHLCTEFELSSKPAKHQMFRSSCRRVAVLNTMRQRPKLTDKVTKSDKLKIKKQT